MRAHNADLSDSNFECSMIHPSRPRSRLVWRLALALLAFIIAVPVGLIVYLSTADLRPILQRMASDELGRAVTVGDLRLVWGRTFKFEVRDFRVANAEWSDWPDMLRIGRMTAVVYLPALLRGVVQYDVLRLEGVDLTLERRDDGARNWRFGEASAPSAVPAAGLALVPKNRRQFPDVKDMLLRDLLITYRSEGSRDIRIGLDEATLAAPDGTSPTQMMARGAYNDIPLQLNVVGGSYTEMRDASGPFPAEIAATSGDARIAFQGGIGEPLDFDGVRGRLDLAIADFAVFLKLFGYERPLAFPVALQSELTHDGDDWRLAGMTGRFKDSAVKGDFRFIEGGHGEPDAAEVDVALDRFAVETLIDGVAEPGRGGSASFRPEDNLATTLKARIASTVVTYRDLTFEALRLQGHMLPGEIAVQETSVGFAGGRVRLDGALRAAGPVAGAASLRLAYAGADAARITGLAGLQEDGMLSGKLDGRLVLAMTGQSFEQALRVSKGQAVIAMAGGAISSALLEKVSLDLRALFRRNTATTPIQCLLAVADIQNGNARILPLALRATDARLAGGGAVDIASGQVDLLLRSDPSSSGGLALDWPLHVTGSLDAPSVAPQPGRGPAWLGQPQELPATLDPAARALAAASGCVP